MYICIYIYTYIHIYIYVYHTHTHTYIYIYIYTRIFARATRALDSLIPTTWDIISGKCPIRRIRPLIERRIPILRDGKTYPYVEIIRPYKRSRYIHWDHEHSNTPTHTLTHIQRKRNIHNCSLQEH